MANSSNQLLFRLCEVLSVIDDNDGLRIKVRLYPKIKNTKQLKNYRTVFQYYPNIYT